MYGYVYETTNLVNGKKYIGKHKSEKFDSWYLGSGIAFKNAVKKYGKENFEIRIIEKVETNEDDLNLKEMYWIKYFDAVKSKNYYNNSVGGNEEGWRGFKEAVKQNLNLGKNRKISEETKIKISKGNTGKKRTIEQRKRISESHKGQKAWNKGKVTPDYVKKKLSASHKGQKAWNKGKKASEETRKKLSEAFKGRKGYRTGKKLSDETKSKISKALKGRPSPRKGVKLSDEIKKKLSESHKGKIPWNKGKKMSK